MTEIGKSLTLEETVKPEYSACVVGSGDIEVLGTPAMIALMEHAALLLVRPDLEEGTTTVGTKLCVSHKRASKIGDHIRVTATLTEVDGRRLSFDLKAEDDKGLLGEGTLERFIIDKARFLSKL